MLLSLKYNFLFIHIAKTGGTSIRAALASVKWRDPWFYPSFLCNRLSYLSGHRLGIKLPRHARIIAAQELLPREYFNSLFKFAFVRNPWDLQVSSFYHITRERPQYLNGHHTFESFLNWKFNPERPYQYHLDTSITLQSDYLIDLHGNIITDFIGRYENLLEDFILICNRIGITPPRLSHLRKARQRSNDYRSYYTDATAELIANYFARDIQLFQYQFDPKNIF